MDDVEKRYQLLLTEGKKIHGISESCKADYEPVWLNKKKFYQGQKYANSYFFSLSFSHLAGLFMILQMPSSLLPLLVTGNSKTVAKLFRRYLSTQCHIYSWYKEDPFDPKSSAYKSLQQVRKMHNSIAKYMNENVKTSENILWLSQYQMGLTQWAFIGPLIMFPQKCGFYSKNLEALEHIHYMWKIIGYLNGIEDRFNICFGTLEETQALFKLIWEKTFKPNILSNLPPSIGFEMVKGIGETIKVNSLIYSRSAFLKYWYQVFEIPVENKLKGYKAKLKYKLIKFTFENICKFDSTRHFMNKVFQKKRNHTVKDRVKIEAMLEKKFAGIEYVSECPFKANIDYYDFEDSKYDKIPVV